MMCSTCALAIRFTLNGWLHDGEYTQYGNSNHAITPTAIEIHGKVEDKD